MQATIYTVNDIKSAVRASGSHFFDPGTMRTFGSRVLPNVFQGPGGVYFVTSEKCGDSPRNYTVRQFFPADAGISTIDRFNEGGSVREATARAAELAATPLDRQFTEAMLALDLAVTGHNRANSESQYPAIDKAIYQVIYLSDGGYTRCIVKEYEDSSGFYMQLIQTGSTDRQPAWSEAYKLQRVVCRVLQTEPCEPAQTANNFIEITFAQQFLADCRKHGNPEATAKDANAMIAQAKQYDRFMVAACNGTLPGCGGEDDPPCVKRAEKRIKAIASKLGAVDVVFGGDPRGCVVKLVWADGETDDWGKEGWCVPIRSND